MGLKNRKYMEGEEFKNRQGWFEFVCVEAFEFVKRFAAECKEGWKKLFWPKKMHMVNTTLPLPFERPLTHREWARRALQICINAETA